jgi:hypothetical protein
VRNFELSWLPMPIQYQIGPPAGLKDYQQAWFWNLFWKSLQQEWPGYLPVSVSLWRLAEAHCRECFEKECSAVMAVWERAEVAGQGVLFYPPLVAIIQEQLKKIKSKRPRTTGPAVVGFSEEPTTVHSECGGFSPSLFDLDVGLNNDADLKKEDLKIEERKPSHAAGVATGKRAQRVQETRDVLRESLRRYGGNNA